MRLWSPTLHPRPRRLTAQTTVINFLAHLTLSYFDPDLQAGNFLGDFVKGKALKALPTGVQRGVAMHRAIDKLTDEHPAVRALNQRVARHHGRYAGVVTDIGFDYFLCENWAQYGPTDFEAFRVGTYWALQLRQEHMAPRVRGYIDGMLRHDWLSLYQTVDGMAHVFGRLRPRLSRPELLDGVEHLVVEEYEAFNQTFHALFPKLQTLAHAYRPDPA